MSADLQGYVRNAGGALKPLSEFTPGTFDPSRTLVLGGPSPDARMLSIGPETIYACIVQNSVALLESASQSVSVMYPLVTTQVGQESQVTQVGPTQAGNARRTASQPKTDAGDLVPVPALTPAPAPAPEKKRPSTSDVPLPPAKAAKIDTQKRPMAIMSRPPRVSPTPAPETTPTEPEDTKESLSLTSSAASATEAVSRAPLSLSVANEFSRPAVGSKAKLVYVTFFYVADLTWCIVDRGR